MTQKIRPTLIVRNLTTRFKVGKNILTIVDHVNFSLYPGKTLALVGESGCGKSLTALSIMRILPHPPALPSTGEVLFHDKNLLTLSEKEMRRIRGDKIAIIFQDPMTALNPVYTIENQLMEVAGLHLNLFGQEAQSHCRNALAEVGIQDTLRVLSAYPHQLSGGLKQRVMIAMALLCNPEILIADEPTTALDVTIQAQIMDLIAVIQKKKGLALLLITHDMGVVANMADEVLVLYTAQQIESGQTKQIFDFPAHPYTAGLFQCHPSSINSTEKLQPIKGQIPNFGNLPSGCRFHPRCPYAMEKCKKDLVPNFVIEPPNHFAKCWLHDNSLESQEGLIALRNKTRKIPHISQ